MRIADYVEIGILLLLLDRSILLRKHYKLAIEFIKFPGKYYWALWIYCRNPQDERYTRNGGKRLIWFEISIK